MNKQLLKDVITDQHDIKLPSPLIPRSVYTEFEKYRRSKQVIILSGLRRCGKSTLLEQIRNDSVEKDYYINFDDDRLVHFQLEDFQMLYEVFIELYGVQNTFYFDEIQNIPQWERFVRRLHDQGNKIYITGSNASMLSRELGTRLTGRHLEIHLYPYSFEEFLQYKKITYTIEKPLTTIQKGTIKAAFNMYLQQGGLPEYLASSPKEYLHSLYESILYRDIIVRHNINEHQSIKELVYYLASNIGKECTYSSLAKIISMSSATTVSSYCSFLEDSFLCSFIHQFDYPLKKQLQSPKKAYFIDHVLAKSVGFRWSNDYSRLLENIVFIELNRQGFEVYYHKKNKECDFLLREQGKIISAIQVCADMSNEETRKREISGLVEAMEIHNLSLGYIITDDTQDAIEMTSTLGTLQISIIPLWKWLLEKPIAAEF